LRGRSSGNAPRTRGFIHHVEFPQESPREADGTTLGTTRAMTDLLETLATPFFAIIDFALAAPAAAAAIASAGTIAAMLVVSA
jgi:hypothetical protein